MLIGYARVSTQEQKTHLQVDALKTAGVSEIHEEKRSGGDRNRPIIKKVIDTLQPGDTLVVVRDTHFQRQTNHFPVKGKSKKMHTE